MDPADESLGGSHQLLAPGVVFLQRSVARFQKFYRTARRLKSVPKVYRLRAVNM
jgi:hypothetical protein